MSNNTQDSRDANQSLPLSEAAEKVGMSRSQFDRLVRDGVIPVGSVTQGGHRRFYIADVKKALVPQVTRSGILFYPGPMANKLSARKKRNLQRIEFLITDRYGEFEMHPDNPEGQSIEYVHAQLLAKLESGEYRVLILASLNRFNARHVTEILSAAHGNSIELCVLNKFSDL